MNDMLNITDNAVKKIHELIIEEGNFNLKLRVFVQGGGCSGFQYGFTFEEDQAEDDFKIEKDFKEQKIGFLIDPLSMQYLATATIDYEENLNGSQFVIKNPNASSTCGCGSSFTV
ncbi:iron-sulfur cluster insertion protein ErpA [archaeon]|nr:iron-sulfur cluster insertion protein ErpA [archaeon]